MASTSIHETTGFEIQTWDIHNPRGEPQKVKSLNFTKNLVYEAQTYFQSLLLSL